MCVRERERLLLINPNEENANSNNNNNNNAYSALCRVLELSSLGESRRGVDGVSKQASERGERARDTANKTTTLQQQSERAKLGSNSL